MSKAMEAFNKRYPNGGREEITFAKPYRRPPVHYHECEEGTFDDIPIYESIDVPIWIVKLIYKSGFEDGKDDKNT